MLKPVYYIVAIIIMLCAAMTFMYYNVSNEAQAAEVNEAGNRYLNEGRNEEAKSAFLQASRYRNIPDSMRTTYFNNLALAYLETAQPDSAQFYYKQAALLNAENSYNYLVSMGNVSLIDNDIGRAVSRFEKAYILDSTKLIVNNCLGLIYLGDYDPSYADPVFALHYNKKAFDILNANGATDGISKSVLAENYYKLNDVSKAMLLFQELHEAYPLHVSYLATLIMLKQEKGLGKEAEILLQKLKQQDTERYQELYENPIDSGTHGIVWNP